MNAEIKQKWVEALRSDKYEQGQHCLKEGNKFCCLGVLTDLFIQEKSLRWEQDDDVDMDGLHEVHILSKDGAPYFQAIELPIVVMKWSGLSDLNPLIDSTAQTLAELNDGGYTFVEIAGFIEKEL